MQSKRVLIRNDNTPPKTLIRTSRYVYILFNNQRRNDIYQPTKTVVLFLKHRMKILEQTHSLVLNGMIRNWIPSHPTSTIQYVLHNCMNIKRNTYKAIKYETIINNAYFM